LALCIPIGAGEKQAGDETSPLHRLEHGLAPWSAYVVLPIFGLANAGVSLTGLGNYVFDPVTIGVALGLFFGKQLGVFGTVFLFVKVGWAQRPAGSNLLQLYGTAILCGIGFTMSLFIGELAYAGSEHHQTATKIGVLAGSATAALLGALVLAMSGRKASTEV
jgi:Na+:H+ antiporter, NhaA family